MRILAMGNPLGPGLREREVKQLQATQTKGSRRVDDAGSREKPCLLTLCKCTITS